VAARRGPALRRRLDDALAPLEDGLTRNASLARGVVLVAPLLGLLGTVTGMIELFDSLGTGTFQAQEGGIAGGIAQALLTTELGLAIAIPGFFATRVLERREARLRDEMERLKCALVGERAGGAR
jgi:biopolymer transport protein ExbB